MKRLLVTQETINQFFMEFDLHKEWREFSTSSFKLQCLFLNIKIDPEKNFSNKIYVFISW